MAQACRKRHLERVDAIDVAGDGYHGNDTRPNRAAVMLAALLLTMMAGLRCAASDSVGTLKSTIQMSPRRMAAARFSSSDHRGSSDSTPTRRRRLPTPPMRRRSHRTGPPHAAGRRLAAPRPTGISRVVHGACDCSSGVRPYLARAPVSPVPWEPANSDAGMNVDEPASSTWCGFGSVHTTSMTGFLREGS